MISRIRILPFCLGVVMSINFVIVWAIPVAGMGMLWKSLFRSILLPIYQRMDESVMMRSFAAKYIYSKPDHADFFAISVLLILNSVISFGFVLIWQLVTGNLPGWLIFTYLCSWVGIGGRVMGGAYALAHKEVPPCHLYNLF